MAPRSTVSLALLVLLALQLPALAQIAPRERTRLDDGWRFALGNAADPVADFGFGTGAPWAKAGEAVGAAAPDFNDTAWREVDLPHDWVVELPFAQDPDSDHVTHGSKPVGRRFPDSTIGWYRKRFSIPRADEGRQISIEFDGVYRDCHVWLNGHLVARNESGYIGFAFDATDYLNYGGDNVLVVRADASHYEGWFYEGAGIYRHAWLLKTGAVHIARDGVTVRTEIAPGRAGASVDTEIVNESAQPATVALRARLIDPEGNEVAKLNMDGLRIGPHATLAARPRLSIAAPKLWSPDHPWLYRVELSVIGGGAPAGPLDELSTRIGFRTILFDKDKGFFLNGQPLKIKGVCCHQDHAGVGSALPDALQYFRIARLKEMGVNAYRTAHHPPTPELLDACDELGMLVMDENRLIGSSAEILSQLRRQVRRDRNRPSVILWSIGNEEPEQYTDRGYRIAETMVRTVRELDPTRPTTFASNAGNTYHGINEVVDVRGFNYFMDGIEPYHREHPDQPIIGSETASAYWTRGQYAPDKERGYLSAYDRNKPGYGALAEEWVRFYFTREFTAGGFAWTGFDYRGEPSPYAWPCISSHFGILDTCGFPKDVFYYYQSWWSDTPVLHLLPHWTWQGHEGQPIDVWCYTNLDRVQLLLNGKDLGTKPVERLAHLEWQVPYQPGTLEAIGFRGEHEVRRETATTTGQPVKLALAIEPTHAPAAAQDAVVITVSALDAEGRPVPTASDDVSFQIEGPGRIIGVGNGDPSSHEPDRVVTPVFSESVGGWGFAQLPTLPEAAPPPEELDEYDPVKFDASKDATIMKPHTRGIFWTKISPSEEDLRASALMLSIGRIDDHARLFVNGHFIGESHDWRASPHFDVTGLLHPDWNYIVALVINDDGPGGIGRGVFLSRAGEPPAWRRKLFAGLAQVIVKPVGGDDGTIRLRTSANGRQPASVEIPRSPPPAPSRP